MKKIIWILCSIIITVSAQEMKTNPLYKADFNQLVSYYGKDRLRFYLPPQKVLDSLQSTPYVWVDGYRIQVAALSDSGKARMIAEKLKSAVNDSVYVEFEKGLYRIQFGDYQKRIIAETKVDSMRKWGWPESWIVTRKVKKYLINSDRIKTVVRADSSGTSSAGVFQGKIAYAIQLGAFSSRVSAESFIKKNLAQFSNAYIIQSGNLFKVLIGPYGDEKSARNMLLKIQQAGFSDAWLTETDAGAN